MFLLQFSVLLTMLVVMAGGHDVTNSSAESDVSATVESTVVPLDSIEQTVVGSILKLVDAKFESLSTRLGTLERAVSNSQYYNLRQFRVINTHLRALDSIMQTSHSQTTELGLDNKETRAAVESLKEEVKSMAKSNTERLSGIEKNFLYLNKEVSQKVEGIHGSIQSLQNATEDRNNNTERLQQWTSIMESKIKGSSHVLTERLGKIDEKLDYNHNLTIHEFSKLNRNNLEEESESKNKSREEEQALIHTLSELNDSVLRSIDFYRHTGDLVERIVGATESVSDDQTKIRNDIRHFLEVQTNNSCNTQKVKDENVDDINNEIPNVIPQQERRCEISMKTLEEMMQFVKNDSRMVETMAEVAQLSQISLKTYLKQFGLEMDKLRQIQQDLSMESTEAPSPTPTPDLFTGLTEYDLETLLNNTKSVFQLAEAIATNTGWIPYIFHSLQFVESQINATLVSTRTLVKTPPWKLFPTQTPPPTEKSLEQRGLLLVNETEEFIQKFNSIYRTSTKMHRLVPALTNLLGEPEPFITLMDGKFENQGRVEIYRKGKWGTLCDNIGHLEASYICRHLGYLGGISAGNGRFGGGEGIFWKINMTCLYNHQCEIASPVVDSSCDHANDAAIVCDHMLRLFKNDDSRGKRNSGEVQIYHRGSWRQVCSDDWTAENTRVVCRQLGYEDGTSVKSPAAKKSSVIWLHDVKCSGMEYHFTACNNISWSREGCNSKTAASLVCS